MPTVDELLAGARFAPSQLENARSIVREFLSAGLPLGLALAAVTNAVAESGLNHRNTSGDSGHSWGLFQINDLQRKRMNPNIPDTIAYTDRLDPTQATRWIIGEYGRWKDRTDMKDSATGITHRLPSLEQVYAQGGSVADLAASFSAHVERPQKMVYEMGHRAGIAKALFPGVANRSAKALEGAIDTSKYLARNRWILWSSIALTSVLAVVVVRRRYFAR